MLDDKILDQARRLIESRFAERGKALPKEVSRIMRKKQINKDLYSSHTENLVRAACEEEIRTKAKIVWDSIQEVHKAHGSSITETLRIDLKEEASRHIENAVREASELMERRLRFMKLNPHHLTLETTKREVNKRISVKVDLYVDSLLCKPAETEINPTKRGRLKPILCAISGLVVFLAALLTIFHLLGWLEAMRAFIYNIVSNN